MASSEEMGISKTHNFGRYGRENTLTQGVCIYIYIYSLGSPRKS